MCVFARARARITGRLQTQCISATVSPGTLQSAPGVAMAGGRTIAKRMPRRRRPIACPAFQLEQPCRHFLETLPRACSAARRPTLPAGVRTKWIPTAADAIRILMSSTTARLGGKAADASDARTPSAPRSSCTRGFVTRRARLTSDRRSLRRRRRARRSRTSRPPVHTCLRRVFPHYWTRILYLPAQTYKRPQPAITAVSSAMRYL